MLTKGQPSLPAGSRAASVALVVMAALPLSTTAQPSLAPPAAEGPTIVQISVDLNKIFGIDTVNETYLVDGYLNVTWSDPRSKALLEEHGRDRLTFENDAVGRILGTVVWGPTLEFINVVGGRDVTSRSLFINREGTLNYSERFHATCTSDMDFRQYPFDRQHFRIEIESFSYDTNDLVFVSGEVELDENKEAGLFVEWTVDEVNTFVTVKRWMDFDEDAGAVASEEFSRFNVEVVASRRPGYFLWQFFLPLGLIVSASWCVFWMRDFSNQLSTTFTLMLTVVAFNFYTSTTLPRLPYNTFIETVIISGYVSIFAAIVSILVAHVLGRRRERAATRLLSLCRWMFPLAYGLAMLAVIRAFFPGSSPGGS